jgi:hypothetical protein
VCSLILRYIILNLFIVWNRKSSLNQRIVLCSKVFLSFYIRLLCITGHSTDKKMNHLELKISLPGELGEALDRKFARLSGEAQLGAGSGTTTAQAGARGPVRRSTQGMCATAGGQQELETAQAEAPETLQGSSQPYW